MTTDLLPGDPIVTDKFRQELHIHRSIKFIVNNLYGHYWFLFFDKRSNEYQAREQFPVQHFAGILLCRKRKAYTVRQCTVAWHAHRHG